MRILRIEYAVPEALADRWFKTGPLMTEFLDLAATVKGKDVPLKMIRGFLSHEQISAAEVSRIWKQTDERKHRHE